MPKYFFMSSLLNAVKSATISQSPGRSHRKHLMRMNLKNLTLIENNKTFLISQFNINKISSFLALIFCCLWFCL